MTESERLAFCTEQLARLQEYYSRIEGRASSLLAVNLAMAGVTVANLSKEVIWSLTALPAIAALVAIGFSLICLISVANSHLENPARPSLIYFDDIAKDESHDYIVRMRAATEADLLSDMMCQIWRNSEILSMKFGSLSWAFRSMCVAVPLWLTFLLFITIKTGGLPMLSTN